MSGAVKIGGWGRTHKSYCKVIEVESDSQRSLFQSTPSIPRGNGLSYGDASTIHDGWILDSTKLKGFLLEGNTLTVGSGETISTTTSFLREFQYELAVVPGTGNVTIGGAISADIHGKNHHNAGSFGEYVLELEIETPNQGRKWIKRTDPEITFSTFVGGMGLSGLIRKAKIKVVPKLSDYIRVNRRSGNGFPKLLELLQEISDVHTYSIAWIDLARISESKFPNWILDSGNDEVGRFEPSPVRNLQTIHLPLAPITWPTPIVKLANQLVYKSASRATGHSIRKDFYFHPLDRIKNWNRLLGCKGFIEYQFVVPFEHAPVVLIEISRILVSHGLISVFAGLKTMGPPSVGLLSFPMEGITLSMDFQVRGIQTYIALDSIDEIVHKAGGRVYLAKDSRLNADNFNLMYPSVELLSQYRQANGCADVIKSDMSRRIGIR